MRRFSLRASAMMGAVLAVGLVRPVWAQVTDVATQANLSSDDVATLQQLDIPVAVPTFVPPGFEVKKLTVKEDAGFGANGEISGYRIVYRQPAGTGGPQGCFEVEAAVGGLGGPVAEHRIDAAIPPLARPLPDYTYQVFWSNDPGTDGPFRGPILFSDWIEGDGVFYRVGSLVHERRYCDRISPATANQILESLRYLDSRSSLDESAL